MVRYWAALPCLTLYGRPHGVHKTGTPLAHWAASLPPTNRQPHKAVPHHQMWWSPFLILDWSPNGSADTVWNSNFSLELREVRRIGLCSVSSGKHVNYSPCYFGHIWLIGYQTSFLFFSFFFFSNLSLNNDFISLLRYGMLSFLFACFPPKNYHIWCLFGLFCLELGFKCAHYLFDLHWIITVG